MKYYYYLKLENDEDALDLETINALAMREYRCTGIEEYSIDEATVDEILGERSYSGGDIPVEVLDEVELEYEAKGQSYKYYFDELTAANEFSLFLKESYKINLETLKGELKDWNESWKESFSPILINDQLEIIPSWYEDYASNSKEQLKIYPGMGFGTGNHETTFLCLKLLFETTYSKKDLSVLDFGCGSGILGLAVKQLNSDIAVDLYDIDQEAIDNCVQNIEHNQMQTGEFGMYLPDQKAKITKKYDLVFANILKNVLLEEAQFIVDTVSKDLIISGLLNGQEQDIIDHYQSLNKNFKVSQILRQGDWCALHLYL